MREKNLDIKYNIGKQDDFITNHSFFFFLSCHVFENSLSKFKKDNKLKVLQQ